MKVRFGAALLALVALTACETLSESYLVEREDVLNENGIHVYSDLMENAWDGSSYFQFRASNYSDYPFCVRVSLSSVSFSNGYEMGYVHYVAPGETRDVGYVHAPARFQTSTDAWDPDENGQC